MLYYIEIYFLLVLIYSFCGWTIETTGELIKSKKFVNRGFLIGPICPIYGIGAIIITLALSKYYDDLFAIFCLSGILCGALEYFTSFIMEKLFKSRWWDYSSLKFNINGRICLETIVLFATAGILIVRFISPFGISILKMIPKNILNIISILLFIIYTIDVIASFNVMNKIKNIKLSVAEGLKDNTEEISMKVREMLLEKSLPYRRILEAFPQAFAERIKVGKEMIAQTAGQIKNNVQDATEKAIERVNEAKDKTFEKMENIKIKTYKKIYLSRYKIMRYYVKRRRR